MKNFNLLFLIFSIGFCSAQTTTINYTSINDDFVNPERGWYRYSETRSSNYTLLDSATIAGYRNLHTPYSANYNVYASLVFRYFFLESFKNSAISTTYLQNIETDFNTARKAGIKIIPRFAYTDQVNNSGCGSWICPPYGDAPKNIVLQHISQLKPILRKHADVIASVQMGFIGVWGENYYTDYFGDASIAPYTLNATNWTDRKIVLDSLLAACPKELNVQVRYPQMKQKGIYGITAPTTSAALTLAEAYQQTNKARTGFHNDCLFANFDDYGTYANYDIGSSDTLKLKPYKANDSKYVMVGGETCNPSAYSTCNNVKYELSRMHYTYLNADYNNAVNNTWVSGGCINEIKRRLGYRLQLKQATLPTTLAQGGNLSYSFQIENVGYAAPVNKRKVLLILQNTSTNAEFMVELNHDPRYWFVGTHTFSSSVCVPDCIPTGNYKLFLMLADPNPSIMLRPQYAIRLANQNMWVPAKGYNDLNHTISITSGSGSCASLNAFYSILPNNYIGPSNQNWNASASNWSLNKLPNFCDEVIILNNKNVTIPAGYNAKARKVTVNPSSTLTIKPGALLETKNN